MKKKNVLFLLFILVFFDNVPIQRSQQEFESSYQWPSPYEKIPKQFESSAPWPLFGWIPIDPVADDRLDQIQNPKFFVVKKPKPDNIKKKIPWKDLTQTTTRLKRQKIEQSSKNEDIVDVESVEDLQPIIHSVKPSIRFESLFQDQPASSTTESNKLQVNEGVTKTVSTTIDDISATTTNADISVDDIENSAKDQVIEKPIEIDEAAKSPVIQVVAVFEEQILDDDDFDEKSGVENKKIELPSELLIDNENIQNSNVTATGFQNISNSNSKKSIEMAIATVTQSSNTEENDLTTVNNTIFEDKRRKPKQILDEQILDSLENDTTTLFPTGTVFPDYDDEDSTIMTISQFSSNSKMQCCACPGGPTPTLTSMFEMEDNADSAFTTQTSESETEPITSTIAIELEETTTSTSNEIFNDDEDIDITTNEIPDETTTESMKDRDGKTIDLDSIQENANPLLNYLQRFQRIYELDLKILGQLAELISGIDKEVLPTLKTSLEPILSTLLAQQNNNLDLGQVISYVTQTVQKSTFHVGISGHLGSYDFLEIGPQRIPGVEQLITEHDWNYIVHTIIANYDKSNLRFPIQKFFLGPRALKMFGSKANSRLVSYILSNKLYDYLTDIRTSVEVKNGEVIFESHMPYLNIVDRCDMSIQTAPSSLKAIVRRSTHLRTGGEFSNILKHGPEDKAAIFEGHVDFDTSLSTSVSVRLGKPFFSKCFTKYNNDMPLVLNSRGSYFLSIKAMATNVRIERRPKAQSRTFDLSSIKNYDLLSPPGGVDDGLIPYLVFKIDFKVNAKIKSFNIDHIYVRNCDIRFGGLRLFSYCGLIKKAIKDSTEDIVSNMDEMQMMPSIFEQIQKILRYRHGDEIAIPLLVAEEKDALIKSLTAKATEIAGLKASLVSDLSNLVGNLNG